MHGTDNVTFADGACTSARREPGGSAVVHQSRRSWLGGRDAALHALNVELMAAR